MIRMRKRSYGYDVFRITAEIPFDERAKIGSVRRNWDKRGKKRRADPQWDAITKQGSHAGTFKLRREAVLEVVESSGG